MRLLRRLTNLGYDVTIAQRPAEEQRPRRRGRPCKCAEWGLPCAHGGRASKALPTEPAPTSKTTGGCWKCERWGIRASMSDPEFLTLIRKRITRLTPRNQ
jgi:hypothetical protein